MAEIHDRMPVILSPAGITDWLDPQVTGPEILKPLLVPCPVQWLERQKVSTIVNKVGNETSDCINPLQLSPDSRMESNHAKR